MSLEHLKEYARRCASEPVLRGKARAIGLADIDEHIRHSKSLGLEWTRRDMVNFRDEMIDSADDLADLSEEELEQVAGGAFSVTIVASLAVGAAVGAGVGAVAGTAAAGGAAAAGGGGW